jgi:hypothetical protein
VKETMSRFLRCWMNPAYQREAPIQNIRTRNPIICSRDELIR